MIADGAESAALRSAARLAGARSLWSAGIARVVAGETTFEEIARVIDEETPDAAPSENDDRRAYLVHELARVSAVTDVKVGVVDVYAIDVSTSPWRALVLRRSRDTRCPGAWEAVHGHIEDGESPEQAAVRELSEETGLEPQRLYNVTVHAFYLHKLATVELAVVFCAFVDSSQTVTLGSEHSAHEWLSLSAAADRCVWPRAAQAYTEIRKLFAGGDAGPAEDVLRVR